MASKKKKKKKSKVSSSLSWTISNNEGSSSLGPTPDLDGGFLIADELHLTDKDRIINKLTPDKRQSALSTSISFINLALPNNSPLRIIKINGLAVENIAITPSLPVFDSHEIPGRSSPVHVYKGGEARSISFTMNIHRDLLNKVTYADQPKQSLNIDFMYTTTNEPEKVDTNKVKNTTKKYIGVMDKVKLDDGRVIKVDRMTEVTIDQTTVTNTYRNNEEKLSLRFRDLLNQLQALNYPLYTKGGVVPPTVFCVIGTDIKIRGIPNITITLQPPIDPYGRYSSAIVNVTITESIQKSADANEVIYNFKKYNSLANQVI